MHNRSFYSKATIFGVYIKKNNNNVPENQLPGPKLGNFTVLRVPELRFSPRDILETLVSQNVLPHLASRPNRWATDVYKLVYESFINDTSIDSYLKQNTSLPQNGPIRSLDKIAFCTKFRTIRLSQYVFSFIVFHTNSFVIVHCIIQESFKLVHSLVSLRCMTSVALICLQIAKFHFDFHIRLYG